MNAIALLGRRAVISLGVVAALLVGVLSIRGAAVWAAGSAPLSSAPVTVDSLQAELAAEQDRSATLQSDLDAMTAKATELNSALDAAGSQVDAGTSTATDLDGRLQAAQARLQKLQSLIVSAQAQLAATVKEAKAKAAAAAAAAAAVPAPTTAAHEGDHQGDGSDD